MEKVATMDRYIANFSEQLSEAYAIGQKIEIKNIHQPIKNILVCGLGGSGIGGNIVKCLVKNELSVPFDVSKDYNIPKYVNRETLVIISSYSGNTEETISAMEQAIVQEAQIFCITSGGKVTEVAKKRNIDYVTVPGGMPPRTCLGYSFVQQLFVLHHLGFIDYDFQSDLLSTINLLDREEGAIQKEAKEVAANLHNKIPVIYIDSEMEAVAVRFRQQLNENSKILCWHHAIPEMNHNELVGWRINDDRLCVILLRNKTDHERVQQRMEINKEVFKKYTPHITEVNSKGETQMQRMFYHIHLGDWISFYLAELRKVDAVEVDVIDYLKGALAKS